MKKKMISKETIVENTKIKHVVHLEEVGSTNDYAKEISKIELIDNLLIVADSQNKGKGRMGKTFFSPKNGLYFSLIIQPKLKIDEIQLITIAAAVALNQTLNDLFHINSKIKWLNDIYIDNKKVSGILTEGVISSSEKYDFIVVGIGINLESPSYLPRDIEHTFTALDKHTKLKLDKNQILINFLNNFEILIENLNTNNEIILDAYRKSCFILDQKVKFKNSEKLYTAIDINSLGHLVVMDDDGFIISLNSGDISIDFKV